MCVTGLILLAGCGSTALRKAPVEDRPVPSATPAPVVIRAPEVKTQPQVVVPAAAAERPGVYTVKPGDTLIRIALESGQTVADLAAWNGLSDPNHIEVGQQLYLTPPATRTAGWSAPTPAGVEVSPVPKPVIVAQSPGAAKKAAAASAPAAAASASGAAASASGAAAANTIEWTWPAAGPVLAGFDELKNKGVDLGGRAGDPVLAAADGRVVYVGAGLRGYGNLIILKHNNVFLSAYAHNQKLLVKEDQNVKRGEKIAEMGNSDADRVKLHFEVRKQGKPVDPLLYLPKR
ncbi:MAG: peptidoglycan DD-metalloendopeptidase family protein [Rhodoferax sp.]